MSRRKALLACEESLEMRDRHIDYRVQTNKRMETGLSRIKSCLMAIANIGQEVNPGK